MNSTALKQLTKDETEPVEVKNRIQTSTKISFFVHKIVPRCLSVVHVFLSFVATLIFIVLPICERR